MRGTKYRTLFIPLSRITPHPLVQRAFDQRWGDFIAANFDPDAFRDPLVVPDGRGGYHVWEGQHSCYGARKALGADQEVPCRVYEEIPPERLARLQHLMNTGRKAWNALDSFRMKQLSKDKAALDITKVLEDAKLRLHYQKSDSSVAAIKAIEWIYSACGRDALIRALGILRGAWGGDPDAYHTNVLRGTGLLVHRYNGELNDSELAAKLAKDSTPGDLIGRARSKHKNDGISVVAAIAALMVNTYNKKRTAHRLDGWS